uniref:Uncharacterized protein n=1 Tax=Knipowitschia caucasica TaxID=637954 RepID=A0AAV2KVT6_KNICA
MRVMMAAQLQPFVHLVLALLEILERDPEGDLTEGTQDERRTQLLERLPRGEVSKAPECDMKQAEKKEAEPQYKGEGGLVLVVGNRGAQDACKWAGLVTAFCVPIGWRGGRGGWGGWRGGGWVGGGGLGVGGGWCGFWGGVGGKVGVGVGWGGEGWSGGLGE